MKNWLLTISSISALVLSSNGFGSWLLITNNNHNNTNRIINKLNDNNNQSLFNKSFNALGDGSAVTDKDGKIISNFYITNQSTSDHKYYSYDLSHANYQLLDSHKYAYHFFIVDSSGLLQYTSDQQSLSSMDKDRLANTKTQMETNKEITTVANPINFMRSYYNNDYFKNNNSKSNWQYLQFGGVENHINIGGKTNGDKVEHYQDLNESLGLYYIAKAVIQNKIDEAVADNLAQYFISQSSLKDKINQKLITKIIKLIVHNNSIYNAIYYTPFDNSNKDYSLNFIFDSNNNLIENYYNKISNFTTSLNYNYSHYYDAWHARDSSDKHTLIKWTDYAPNWELFTTLYPNFSIPSSYLKIADGDDPQENDNLTANSSQIKTDQGIGGDTNSIFAVDLNLGLLGGAHLSLDLWHNDTEIFWKWFYWSTNLNINLDVKLSSVVFNSIN